MPIRHTHREAGDACRMANALDLIGDRWSLVLVRELLLGPKRFSELQSAARGITPAVLTARLRDLQRHGIVTSPEHGRRYELTTWGAALEDVIQALGRWHSAGPSPDTEGELSPDGFVIALRTMAPTNARVADLQLIARPAAAAPVPTRHAHVHSNCGHLSIEPVEPDAELPDCRATLDGDASVLAGVCFGRLSWEEALDAGLVAVTGDQAAVTRFVDVMSGAINW